MKEKFINILPLDSVVMLENASYQHAKLNKVTKCHKGTNEGMVTMRNSSFH
jgi:hypothetical protein